jgi:hypothetical protein
MPDMSKPGAFLQDVLDTFEGKKRECWQQARDAKLRGEIYEECASELRYALEKEAKLAAVGKPGEQG